MKRIVGDEFRIDILKEIGCQTFPIDSRNKGFQRAMEFFIFPSITAAQNNLPVFDALLAGEIRNPLVDKLGHRSDSDFRLRRGLLTIETVRQLHRRPQATGCRPLFRHSLITHADIAQTPVFGIGIRTAGSKCLRLGIPVFVLSRNIQNFGYARIICLEKDQFKFNQIRILRVWLTLDFDSKHISCFCAQLASPRQIFILEVAGLQNRLHEIARFPANCWERTNNPFVQKQLICCQSMNSRTILCHYLKKPFPAGLLFSIGDGTAARLGRYRHGLSQPGISCW